MSTGSCCLNIFCWSWREELLLDVVMDVVETEEIDIALIVDATIMHLRSVGWSLANQLGQIKLIMIMWINHPLQWLLAQLVPRVPLCPLMRSRIIFWLQVTNQPMVFHLLLQLQLHNHILQILSYPHLILHLRLLTLELPLTWWVAHLFSHFSPSKQSSVILVNGSKSQVLDEVFPPIVCLFHQFYMFWILLVIYICQSTHKKAWLFSYLFLFLSFFPPCFCVFQDLCTRKMITGGHEWNGVYLLSTIYSIYTLFIRLFNIVAFWIRIPPLRLFQILGFLVDSSLSFDCESCQVREHHQYSFAPQVNKVSPKSFS